MNARVVALVAVAAAVTLTSVAAAGPNAAKQRVAIDMRLYPQKRDGQDDGIGIGTWKVVRGTGQYGGIVGKGRFGQIGLGSPWYARFEGVLTAS